MGHGSLFGWADDSSGPIDTTPANLPRPADSLIEVAAEDVPPIMADVRPDPLNEISLVGSALTARLQQRGHTTQAACWAVHRLVVEGRLLAQPAYDETPTRFIQTGSRRLPGLKKDTRETSVVGGGFSVRPISLGKPAPFETFRVVATESLWNWWRKIEAQKQERSAPPAATPDQVTAKAADAPVAETPAGGGKVGKDGKRKTKRKPGPKGPRNNLKKDREILEGWDTWRRNGGERSIEAYAKEKHGATNRKQVRAVELAIGREKARRKRKGQNSRDKLPPRQ